MQKLNLWQSILFDLLLRSLQWMMEIGIRILVFFKYLKTELDLKISDVQFSKAQIPF